MVWTGSERHACICGRSRTAQAVVRVARKGVIHKVVADGAADDAHAAGASCAVEEDAASRLGAPTRLESNLVQATAAPASPAQHPRLLG